MNSKWRDATKSGDLNIVCMLLDAEIDINSLDEHGQTALMNAAHSGDVGLIQVLIQSGADLNHTAKYRLTALMLAVISNHLEIVRLLVDAGADMEIKGSKTPFDRTPLEYAQENGRAGIASILRKNAPNN